MAEAKIIGVLDLTEARKVYDEFIRHVSGAARVGIPTGIAPTGTVSGGGGLAGGIAGTSTYTVPNLIGTSSGVSGGQIGGISGVPGGASGEMGNAAKELADAVRSAAAQIRATIGGGGGNVGIGASRGGASTPFRGGLSLSDITAERAGRLDALRNAYTPFVDSPEKDAYHAERRFQAETSPSRELSQRVSEYRSGVRQADRIGNLEGRAELARAVTPEFRREILSARRDATEEGTEEYARADLDLANEQRRGRGGANAAKPDFLSRAVRRFVAPYFALRAARNLTESFQGEREAEFRSASANDLLSFYEADKGVVENFSRSYIGIAGDVVFGLGGLIETPTEKRKRVIERSINRVNFDRETITNNSQINASDADIEGFRQGGIAGRSRAGIISSAATQITTTERQIAEYESLNSGVVATQNPDGDQIRGFLNRSSLIRQSQQKIGGIQAQRDLDLRISDQERQLKARTIGNQAADAADYLGGLSERTISRNSLERRQRTELEQQSLSDSWLTPARRVLQDYETLQQEEGFRREDEVASIRNRGGSRAARARTRNDPFGASVANQDTENQLELLALRRRGSPTAEVEQRQGDDARAMASEMLRSVVYQQADLNGQSSVLAASLRRDPLGSTIAGIRANTQAQQRSASSLPSNFYGVNLSGILQDQIGGVGQQREALATQQFNDERLSSRAELEFRNESLGILGQSYAEGGGSYSSRVRRAESNTTLRRTQLDSLRAAQSGRSDLIPGIEEGGRKTLTAQRERYLAAFTAQEGGSGVIGGTSSAQAVLDGISAASAGIGNAKAGGLDGKGDPVTMQGLTTLLKDVVRDATTVQ